MPGARVVPSNTALDRGPGLLCDLKMEHFGAVFKLDLTEETRTQIARGGGNCLILSHTGYTPMFVANPSTYPRPVA